jgi:drug/metabolite transporter (DMT)-like permease
MFAVPLFGVTLSVAFLGESFTTLQIVGALVTVVGALLAIIQGRPGRASSPAAPSSAASSLPALSPASQIGGAELSQSLPALRDPPPA